MSILLFGSLGDDQLTGANAGSLIRSCKYFCTRSFRTGRCLPGSSLHSGLTNETFVSGMFAPDVTSLDGKC